MKIEGLELRWLSLPLVGTFRTSFGSEDSRDLLLLRLVTDRGEGWSECVAMSEPVYSPEYVDAAAHVIEHVLFPAVAALSDPDVHAVSRSMQRFHGHQMAKAALETAFLDAELRSLDLPLARYLGGAVDRVASGVSVGIMDSIPQLLEAVAGYLDRATSRSS
jgi:O-succinylbenzoate synthase